MQATRGRARGGWGARCCHASEGRAMACPRRVYVTPRHGERRKCYVGKRRLARSASEGEASVANEGIGIEKSSTSFEAVMDIDAIMKILPHRYPFLLVDRIVKYEQGKEAVGLKNVTINDNFFPGHFPARPIMPGVLIVEALAQVGGIALMDPDDPKENFFFGGIDGCKFRKPVVPGDTLMLKVALKKINKRFGVAKTTAQAFVGEDLVCEAELTLYMGN